LKITESSSLGDVAFAVCTALHRAGVTAVLSGGSAATVYAPEAYQSTDRDFIITFGGASGRGERALFNLGYERKTDHYQHPRSPFPVEFPRGPLMVGDDHIERWDTMRRARHVLHILSPTDSCRDRLASFLFWNDFSGLEQALAVARSRRREVDLELIGDWCARERASEKFELFARRLRRGRL
jgi:hypothetical protein